MSYQVPSEEYENIIAGLTVKWRIYLADYLPADGWTLKYALKKSTVAVISITASQDPTYTDQHLVNVAPAVSGTWTAGEYTYQAWVENSTSGEKYIVETGIMEIKAMLSASATAYDPRTHAQTCLDAIKAVLEGRATKNQLSVSINNKQIQYMKFSELLELKEYYEAEVESEKQQDALDNGETNNWSAYYAEFEKP